MHYNGTQSKVKILINFIDVFEVLLHIKLLVYVKVKLVV
jgi:hypothetical protein